ERGHTTRGPHRADWKLTFARAPRHEQLSRGQEKLCAIACMLAQGGLFREDHAEWPIVVLDDLASELDPAHQGAVLECLGGGPEQIFLSGTEIPRALTAASIAFHGFH